MAEWQDILAVINDILKKQIKTFHTTNFPGF